jgi:HSP20 family protein
MNDKIAVQRKTPESEVARGEPQQVPVARPERLVRISPRTDVLETKESYLLTLDMPGVAPSDVAVHFEEGVISVKGRARSPATEGRTPLYRGYDAKEYYRSFQLPDGVESTKIEAKVQDGVLTLALPKAEQARPRQIEVKAS